MHSKSSAQHSCLVKRFKLISLFETEKMNWNNFVEKARAQHKTIKNGCEFQWQRSHRQWHGFHFRDCKQRQHNETSFVQHEIHQNQTKTSHLCVFKKKTKQKSGYLLQERTPKQNASIFCLSQNKQPKWTHFNHNKKTKYIAV